MELAVRMQSSTSPSTTRGRQEGWRWERGKARRCAHRTCRKWARVLLLDVRFLSIVHTVALILDRVGRLLLAFCAYFAIGAYYNYSTYGARGLDLIP